MKKGVDKKGEVGYNNQRCQARGKRARASEQEQMTTAILENDIVRKTNKNKEFAKTAKARA